MKGFSIPKRGMKASENEDAYSISPKGWLAIADGATESSYSREWAGRLTRSFVWLLKNRRISPNESDLRQILKLLQGRWYKKVPWEELSWFSKEKAKQGAFATFLGIRLNGCKWGAVGIGDCNLFVIGSDNSLIRSIPASSYEKFGASPYLLPSIPGEAMEKALNAMWRKSGTLKAGEWIVAATDAVSAYLLYEHEQGTPRFDTLMAINSPEDFSSWVENSRSMGMRNDDSTIIMVHGENRNSLFKSNICLGRV